MFQGRTISASHTEYMKINKQSAFCVSFFLSFFFGPPNKNHAADGDKYAQLRGHRCPPMATFIVSPLSFFHPVAFMWCSAPFSSATSSKVVLHFPLHLSVCVIISVLSHHRHSNTLRWRKMDLGLNTQPHKTERERGSELWCYYLLPGYALILRFNVSSKG